MFTAEDARQNDHEELDRRIKAAVREAGSARNATIRVYIEDWFCRSIGSELERRGFVNVQVPDICLKGDVYFEW